MRFSRRIASVSASLALLLLVGCSVLPKSQSLDIYRLPASTMPHHNAASVTWSLRINTPQADRTLDSSRIGVMPQADVVSVYQGGRWNDRTTVILRDRLMQAFRDDGRVAALSSDDSNLQADFLLDADLTSFQVEYRNGQPVVVIRYNARLVRNSGLRIVAAQRFEVTQPAGGTSVPQVISAFGQACDTLAAQVVSWTMQQSLDAQSTR